MQGKPKDRGGERTDDYRPDDPFHGEKRPVDARPYFVIPYWAPTSPGDSGDNGELRPLPANVTSYLCSSIHASAYAPGTALTVTVDVRNFGDGNSPSLARVTVWWADPNTGFVADPTRLIGIDVVPVPPRGEMVQATRPMTQRIPASAPNHVCLLACVSHQLDLANTTTPNPAGDRHWAQRNLSVVTAVSELPIMVPFMAGNPFDHEAEFTLLARAVPEEHYRQLADIVEAEPIRLDARLSFRGEGNHNGHDGTAEQRIQLRAREQRPMELRVELGAIPQRGQFTGIEIIQAHGGDRSIGSLGIIVRGNL